MNIGRDREEGGNSTDDLEGVVLLLLNVLNEDDRAKGALAWEEDEQERMEDGDDGEDGEHGEDFHRGLPLGMHCRQR